MSAGVFDNPVFVREMRSRLRGARAYWLLFGYLGFLIAVLLVMYASWLQRTGSSGSGFSEAGKLGQSLFWGLISTQVFLVLFITPAISSGALTTEREQQTLDMLAITPLSRIRIVAGKLLAAVAFTTLLLVSSVPLVSICFMLGGVDPGTVASVYLALFAVSVLFGAVGLIWSAGARTTAAAVLAAYGTVAVLGIGSLMVGAMHYGQLPIMGSGWAVIQAVGDVVIASSLFGMQVLPGTGGFVLCLLFGALLTCAASNRLDIWPERRAWLPRLLMAATVGVLFSALVGWWIGQAPTPSNGGWLPSQVGVEWGSSTLASGTVPALATGMAYHPIGAFTAALVMLILITPIFATGDATNCTPRQLLQRLGGGFRRSALGRGVLTSGPAYGLLLAIECIALYAAGAVLTGHRSLLGSNGGAEFARASVLLVLTTTGIALLGVFLSLALKQRFAAWLVTTAAIGFCWAVPAVADISTSAQRSRSPLSVLGYTNPMGAMAQLADAASGLPGTSTLGSAGHRWLVSCILWAVVGAVSLALSCWLLARRSRRLLATARARG